MGDAGGRKKVNLALQGGGAHGAFTWGVLDRLLEDERIEIEGISGTSAGAMNGAVLMQGFITDGRAGARAALERFWRRMSDYAPFGLVHATPLDKLTGNWNLDGSPGYLTVETLMRFVSPYEFNPLDFNPLRLVLEETIDIPKVRACAGVKLFVSATNVHTGKIRVFDNSDVSIDALLASACLPNVFRSVVIDGEPYWDGGYMGNPAIFPLIYGCESRDVIVVEINPLTREGVPQSATEINNRLNEISFNSSLMGEMRAIDFVGRLLESDEAVGGRLARMKKMLIHMIEGGRRMIPLGIASKFNADLDFLLYLRGLGREAASEWLELHFDALGHRSSVDVRRTFL